LALTLTALCRAPRRESHLRPRLGALASPHAALHHTTPEPPPRGGTSPPRQRRSSSTTVGSRSGTHAGLSSYSPPTSHPLWPHRSLLPLPPSSSPCRQVVGRSPFQVLLWRSVILGFVFYKLHCSIWANRYQKWVSIVGDRLTQ
jgi:hypothetical protein